jgi:hypothetical protein
MTTKLDLSLDDYREALVALQRAAGQNGLNQSSRTVTLFGWLLLGTLAVAGIVGSLYFVADQPSRMLPEVGKFAGGAGAWILLYILMHVGNRAIVLGRWRGVWLLTPILLAIIGAAVLYFAYGAEDHDRTITIFIPWYVLASFGWAYLRRASDDPIAVAYKKYIDENGEEQISATDEGISLSSALRTFFYRWTAFKRVLRTSNLIVLPIGNGFIPIRKRDLSPEQSAELELLLANHVERKERAFPVLEQPRS